VTELVILNTYCYFRPMKIPLGPTGTRLGPQLRAVRRARNLTLGGLSCVLTDLGHPINVSALAKAEKGQRRIDVDDLIALAVAVDTSPNALLLPAKFNFGDAMALTELYYQDVDMVWAWALQDRAYGQHPRPRLPEVR